MASQNKSSVKIAPGAVVCDECELIGDITIGARTVIHPKVRIIAEAGPVIIGEYNIIEELVHITNQFPEGEEEKKNSQVMLIGNNNVFEVGAHIDAVKIGDHNVIESKAYVGPEVELTSGCIIGASCRVTTGEQLPENTVIYGANCHRRFQRERPPAQNLQIDFLTKDSSQLPLYEESDQTVLSTEVNYWKWNRARMARKQGHRSQRLTELSDSGAGRVREVVGRAKPVAVGGLCLVTGVVASNGSTMGEMLAVLLAWDGFEERKPPRKTERLAPPASKEANRETIME
ncbi:hypothetical protein C0Q70_03287 [Pomacea canaliculata]|uniref:Dynactin subunit 6 n=1 Tax=Pomacea canaliculata TaxID=400727 RepID=A0A2T7PSB6_POMCA|nr:hypothetical protein C0Q70_03287 [Pomacea canaliculata]